MAGGCFSLKCSDICRCIQLTSVDGSIVIDKDSCVWDLSLNTSLLTDITATFDPISRNLCLLNHGVVINCVNIPDSDDQYLELNGNILSIHKVDGTVINDIDLTPILPVVPPETPFTLTSTSLQVTPGGTNGHSPNIELIPSTDATNILVLGSDGRPFVPATGQKDIIISTSGCISFNKSVGPTAITFTPVINYACVAANVCPICKECQPPAIAITDIQTNSFKLFISNLAATETFDISLDGGATFTILGLSASPYTVAGLTDNTTYQVVIRHNCVGGGTAVTNIQTITTDLLVVCGDPDNIVITYGPYDFNTGKYPATITWDAVPGAVSYIVTDNTLGILGTVTANTLTFNIAPSTSFSGTIQTNCGTGGNSSQVPYADVSPMQAVCPPPTNLAVTIS